MTAPSASVFVRSAALAGGIAALAWLGLQFTELRAATDAAAAAMLVAWGTCAWRVLSDGRARSSAALEESSRRDDSREMVRAVTDYVRTESQHAYDEVERVRDLIGNAVEGLSTNFSTLQPLTQQQRQLVAEIVVATDSASEGRSVTETAEELRPLMNGFVDILVDSARDLQFEDIARQALEPMFQNLGRLQQQDSHMDAALTDGAAQPAAPALRRSLQALLEDARHSNPPPVAAASMRAGDV